MNIFFHHSYNLDCLNLLNILSGDAQLNSLYPREYAEFGQPLSLDAREVLTEITGALGSTLISPPIAFALSVIPQFDKAPLIDLLLDQEGFQRAIDQNEPRLKPQQDQLFLLFQFITPVVQEIELLGFREYWLSEYLTSLDDRLEGIEKSLFQSELLNSISILIPQTYLPEEAHVFICALNGQHGVRLTKHSSQVDKSFSDLQIFDFCIHELFQTYLFSAENRAIFLPLKADSFLQLAFEKSKSFLSIDQIESYLLDNIIEAFKLYLLHSSGLMPDPSTYLQTYKSGSYVLSMVLLDYLLSNADRKVSAGSFLNAWMDSQPVGNMVDLYRQALERIGDS